MTGQKLVIIESALKLFTKGTYESVSIRKIANEAEISHSLIHRHWDSKKDLFQDVVTAAFSDISDRLFEAAVPNEAIEVMSPETVFRKLISLRDHNFFKLLEFAVHSEEALDAFRSGHPRESADLFAVFGKNLEGLISRQKERGKDLPFTADSMMFTLLLIIHSPVARNAAYILNWSEQRSRMAMEQVIDNLLIQAYSLRG